MLCRCDVTVDVDLVVVFVVVVVVVEGRTLRSVTSLDVKSSQPLGQRPSACAQMPLCRDAISLPRGPSGTTSSTGLLLR